MIPLDYALAPEVEAFIKRVAGAKRRRDRHGVAKLSMDEGQELARLIAKHGFGQGQKPKYPQIEREGARGQLPPVR